ncbi:energy-coupled thiamine transporter ThiT [Candidatus Bathyarchaeota archaeon]|nr:energy-coupled thiamine transporter ThiT [Candidatus Bathyarchaeota archaeon]
MNETKTRFNTKVLAEIAVFAALSAVLYILRPYTLPYGGSVTLGSMVPVMWLSMRRGIYAGIVSAAIFGILALLIDVTFLGAASVIATPVQVILEYPIAFGVLGLAGIFHKKTVAFAIAGVGISIFIKFVIHYLVGVFVWYYVYAFPPEWGQYLWPAIYNGSFLLVEFIISAILIVILVKRGTLEYAL